MITGFGHVGIYVKNLDEVLEVYERIFDLMCSHAWFLVDFYSQLFYSLYVCFNIIGDHGNVMDSLALSSDDLWV